MKDWKCRSNFLVKNLVEPNSVPFFPTWIVGFNSGFPERDKKLMWDVDRESARVEREVHAWIEKNASARMLVFKSGEVICEDETDAELLFLAFQ